MSVFIFYVNYFISNIKIYIVYYIASDIFFNMAFGRIKFNNVLFFDKSFSKIS